MFRGLSVQFTSFSSTTAPIQKVVQSSLSRSLAGHPARSRAEGVGVVPAAPASAPSPSQGLSDEQFVSGHALGVGR